MFRSKIRFSIQRNLFAQEFGENRLSLTQNKVYICSPDYNLSIVYTIVSPYSRLWSLYNPGYSLYIVPWQRFRDSTFRTNLEPAKNFSWFQTTNVYVQNKTLDPEESVCSRKHALVFLQCRLQSLSVDKTTVSLQLRLQPQYSLNLSLSIAQTTDPLKSRLLSLYSPDYCPCIVQIIVPL